MDRRAAVFAAGVATGVGLCAVAFFVFVIRPEEANDGKQWISQPVPKAG